MVPLTEGRFVVMAADVDGNGFDAGRTAARVVKDGEGLSKFDLVGAVCALLAVLNAYEPAYFACHEHRNSHKPLCSLFR